MKKKKIKHTENIYIPLSGDLKHRLLFALLIFSSSFFIHNAGYLWIIDVQWILKGREKKAKKLITLKID